MDQDNQAMDTKQADDQPQGDDSNLSQQSDPEHDPNANETGEDVTPTDTANETAEGEDSAAVEKRIRELEEQLEAARSEADENRQKWMRAQADFDNFRKRTRAEKEELTKYASLSVIEKLLPCLDNFDRALASSRENHDYDALVKGLDMIYKQFGQILEQEEVKTIEAVGQPFNPEVHQAVMQVESEDHDEGIVVEELQKGYMLKDRVIRPSMVKVSK